MIAIYYALLAAFTIATTDVEQKKPDVHVNCREALCDNNDRNY